MTTKEEIQYWDSKSEDWRSRRQEFGPMLSDVVQKIKNETEQLTNNLPSNGKVLDIGTGAGSVSYFGQHTAQVHGIDISHRMLTTNRELENKCQADCLHLPYPSNSMDACSSIFVMRYLDKPQQIQFVQEIGRVLKPSGDMLIIDLPDNNNPLQKDRFDAEEVGEICRDMGMDLSSDRVDRVYYHNLRDGYGSHRTYEYTLEILKGIKK